ncbi:flavin reductase family protein [Tsuneonella amylolytica]|uniref:flavin reductase family protein n=1 Tax=Tsuneonella amylolytica TaxID=2338327 RepID=UPI0013C3E721|nr:flavin reductase family protein [Tsuneonella amylolytica]
MAELDPATRYKLLVNTVHPRPIAWIVSTGSGGMVNAAPYSFFNAMGGTPPLVAIGIGADDVRAGEARKDSLRNILDTEEFTIALVGEDQAEAMVLTAADAPADASEAKAVGVALVPSSLVAPPRIADAPVAFECRLWRFVETHDRGGIVIGEVLATHIDDRFVGDEDGRLRIDAPAMKLVGRAHGAGWYWRGSDRTKIDRVRWPLED